MRKIIRTGVSVSLAAMIAAMMMSGCGSTEDTAAVTETAADTEQGGEEVQMGNPWRDCTEQEAREACEGLFKLPEAGPNCVTRTAFNCRMPIATAKNKTNMTAATAMRMYFRCFCFMG